MVIVIVSLIISIIAVVAVVYREFIHDLVYKPKLEVTFSLDEPISREETLLMPQPPPEVVMRDVFVIRLGIKNTGRVLARKCEGILSEVRNHKGELITRYEPLPLRWAISPHDRGLQPLDIASKRVVYLDLLFTLKDSRWAFLPTTIKKGYHSEDFPFEKMVSTIKGEACFEPGDYWLSIAIYGDNFGPVEKGYAVHWDGKNYKGIDMQEMNEKPSAISPWPWSILEKTESSI